MMGRSNGGVQNGNLGLFLFFLSPFLALATGEGTLIASSLRLALSKRQNYGVREGL